MAALTIEEREQEIEETREAIKALDDEYSTQPFPEDKRARWNELNENLERQEKELEELKQRKERLNVLTGDGKARMEDEHSFQIRRAGVARGDDIYDLSTVRASITSPEQTGMELRDRAMRSLEKARFAHPHADQEQCRSHVAHLLDTIDGPGEDKVQSEMALRMLRTGSPVYKRAFGKYLRHGNLAACTNDEARALSVGTGSAGGFAIVYTLDPTIIPTSNGTVNPWRAVASVEQIAGTNEWRGVTSGAVSATRVAEGTEATDNAPTLAQPALVVTKAHTFIPFSIEIGQDWGGMESEMARLIQDAKDVEEGAAFATGNGTTPNPQGVITGATNTTAAGGVASFAVADVYKVWEAVPARFRPRAIWVANLFTYDKIRQFDTAGGASLFVPNLQLGFQNQGMPHPNSGGTGMPQDANLRYSLLQRPAYESADMAAALTTGSKIAVVGDFSYYKIVDRIGLDIEIVPQLFGATSRFPTGQRGIYAYWRNYGKVLNAAAFQVLVTG